MGNAHDAKAPSTTSNIRQIYCRMFIEFSSKNAVLVDEPSESEVEGEAQL